MLIDLDFLGIHNVLVLRGDPVKSEPGFKPHPEGHGYACELIEQVRNMNRGVYLHEEQQEVTPTDFCIGAAGYPEKHFEVAQPRYRPAVPQAEGQCRSRIYRDANVLQQPGVLQFRREVP